MKNISIGQYYAADSPIHRLDARTKLILAILCIVCTFICKSTFAFVALMIFGVLLVLISRIPPKVIFRAMKPIVFIMLFTALINIFWTGGEILLFEWKFIKVYAEGLYNAAFMTVRIIVLIIGSSIFLTYTTTPIALTDGTERLLSPLKKIKVPVHEFAMMMSIALRFVPTLIDEADRIMSAQKARRTDFSSGGLIKRAKALIPIIIPLFVSAFRRADELATAMECRCYHGGEGRTKLHVTHLGFSDFFALILMIAFGAALVLINIYASKYGLGYVMP